MAPHIHDGRSRLIMDLEPELRCRIEEETGERQLAVRDYVVEALRNAVGHQEPGDRMAWGRLSVPAFSRDWESEADAMYDELE